MRYLWYKVYYEDDDRIILLVHGLQEELFRICNSKIYVILTFPWMVAEEDIRNLSSLFPRCFNFDTNLRILVNSLEEYNIVSKYFKCVLYSNACAVLDNPFITKPLNGIDNPFITKSLKDYTKRFSGVINSRLSKFKRHYLTYNLENIAYITDYDLDPSIPSCSCLYNQLCKECYHSSIGIDELKKNIYPSSQIFVKISPDEICDILDASEFGLILSPEEGACYASIEYLLRGLPVISTPSKGGRDVYYDDTNSIITDDIHAGIKIFKEKNFNRDNIRKEAINKVNYFRDIYKNTLKDFLPAHIDTNKYFDANIFHFRYYLTKDVDRKLIALEYKFRCKNDN